MPVRAQVCINVCNCVCVCVCVCVRARARAQNFTDQLKYILSICRLTAWDAAFLKYAKIARKMRST